VLQAALTAEIFVVFMAFARVGSAFVLLPTIGESFLSPRTRLALAVMVSLVVAPVVAPIIPERPEQLAGMLRLIGIEILIGLFIGAVTRLLFSALAIAGSFYSFLSGLASAFMFNPLMADQGSLLSVFLSLFGLLLIFATDTHHLLIRAVVESYLLFEPGVFPMVGDMADVVTRTVADAFRIGLQFAAPIVVVALMFYVLLGLLARLMPQMQVFFIAMPLQILLGLVILMITMGGAMTWFMREYQDLLSKFLIT
jgi:flagellar biosynthetic protein FliR